VKKIILTFFSLLGLLIALVAVLLASGTVSLDGLRMAANVMFGVKGPSLEESAAHRNYELPPGFALQIFASDLPRARFMRFTPAGDLLVSRPHSGDIVLLRKDADGDGRHDGRESVLMDLNRPQGLDFYRGWLYVAERDKVGRINFSTGRAIGPYRTVLDNLTGDGNHWSKTLRVGPDELIYLTQGSTCNACIEKDPRRAAMMRFRPDGREAEIIATGLRNSVGFDWAPWDGGLYATDNGRDMLGDDFPVCELNLIEKGRFYGWPYFNDNNVPDPDMGDDPFADQRSPTAPVHGFAAHNAPLGISFIDTSGWPGDYQRVALVALHGSWNRSSADGYKVVSLHFTQNGIEQRDFLTGFHQDGRIFGRPVDVIQGPDKAIYISDDYAGAIYRVVVADESTTTSPTARPVGLSTNQRESAAPDWLQQADAERMAAAGEQLYAQHQCGRCHQEGENPVSLAGLSRRMGYTAVIDALQAPQAPMPLFPLSTLEQRQLAVYLLNHDQ